MQGVRNPINILLVEDNPGDARLVEEYLAESPEQQEGFECHLQHVTSAHEAQEHLREAPVDAILLDLGLPDSQGLDTLHQVKASAKGSPIVVLTIENDRGVGLTAVRQGAQDYLIKGHLDPWLLPRAVYYAIERRQHQQQTLDAQMKIQEARVRAESAEKARSELEREVAERKRAEAQVRELNSKLSQRLERLAALHSIDRVINASMNLDLTLEVVLKQVTQQLTVDAAAVLLYREDSLTLEHAASQGFRDPAVRERRVRLGEGPIGRAALNREPLHLPDLAIQEVGVREEALAPGEAFCCYHAAPLIAKGQLRGWLEVFHRESFDADPDWLGFFEALAEQTAIAVDNAMLLRGMQRSNSNLALAYDRTIEGWARALDLRDEETEGHSRRVTELTVQLARDMGVSDEALVHIRRGALLHDIGKMGVPDSILLKPGKLNGEEWEVMKRHTTHAHELLSPIAFLRPALDIPYCHHERWDGGGYPRGLKGEQIPLAARLFAVVDVYDALTSNRPYRKAWDEARTLAHIEEQAGRHFDPQVVEAFLGLQREEQH